ncbi:cleft lip and palate transmembrane protein [Anaeramoeba flamelloides]|uniref:Cleft lip and palate transmembrane protein n=1 Tax=Anaeramoeba flamelloides TaxID=1746091 RepID=A0ABQ8Z7S6_9EUKA|nr:cleft lip and palate transmembrane protein [Anaeramoeba flamelloides]
MTNPNPQTTETSPFLNLLKELKKRLFAGGIRGAISKIFMLWMIINFFLKKNKKGGIESKSKSLPALSPAFSPYQKIDYYIYFSENKKFEDFNDTSALVWSEKKMVFAMDGIKKDLIKTINVTFTPEIKNNGSLYAHIYIAKSGKPIDPKDENFKRRDTAYKRAFLTKYKKEIKVVEKKSLLSSKSEELTEDNNNNNNNNNAGDAVYSSTYESNHENYDNYDKDEKDKAQEEQKEKEQEEEIIIKSYWYSNLTIGLVNEFTAFKAGQVPPHVVNLIDYNKKTRKYYPIIYINEFWMLKEYLIPINETVDQLPLTIKFEIMPAWKFHVFTMFKESLSMQQQIGNSLMEDEQDELKKIFLETNPYLLGITITVSIFHSLFEFLAFKNDIMFWKNKKNLQGLSIRSIFIESFCQLIIFLYLMDNKTSWLVLLSSGVGVIIEFWKIKQVCNIQLLKKFPFIKFTDKESYANSKTKEYDNQAMKYLSWASYPLLIGYSIYALIYQKHKSWYSWLLNSLVGAIYTFGFIKMLPQLFINYKLKSVAAMNWKTMTYKTITTFIDDLFAWVIKMPTLHRIATLRDDVVFVIYLYQRWKYRVDANRVNEYGQVEAEREKLLKNKNQSSQNTIEKEEKKITKTNDNNEIHEIKKTTETKEEKKNK